MTTRLFCQPASVGAALLAVLLVGLLAGCETPAGSAASPSASPSPSAPAAAAPPPEPAAPPPEPPVFEAEKTYAIVELNGAPSTGILAFCDVTVLRRYRLRYNRENWPTCSSRELLVGVSRAGTPGEVGRFRLSDGRQLEIWEIIDLATGVDAPPLEGRYALAARTAEQDTIEIFTGRVPVYQIVPGKVHYLGVLDGETPVSARDIRSFFRDLRAEFPSLDARRFERSALGGLDVGCKPALGSTDARITGFDCLGQRLRGSFF